MHRPPLPQENPWYSFLEAESTPGHMVLSVATEKIPIDTTAIDPETVWLVAQCLNHYATPRPSKYLLLYVLQITEYFMECRI